MWHRLADNFIVAKSEKITTIYRLDAENKNCTMNDADRKEPEQKPPVKQEVKNKSLQLLHGVNILFDLNHFIRKGKYGEIIKRLKYLNWIIKAVVLLIKLRIFKFDIKVN